MYVSLKIRNLNRCLLLIIVTKSFEAAERNLDSKLYSKLLCNSRLKMKDFMRQSFQKT